MLDVTAEEETCCDANLAVAVDESGNICGMQKYGRGGLNPELTFEMIEVSKTIFENAIVFYAMLFSNRITQENFQYHGV